MKKVIIAGASGLIGTELLTLLLQDGRISEVLALVRFPLPTNNTKLKQLKVNFDKLSDYKDQIEGDAIYCCLGSTKKKTPNLNDYHKVDHEYPLTLAKIALENKIAQYHLISALGADKNSKVFYPRLKGRIEEDVKDIPLQSVHIYQPSLLVGNRNEHRAFEKFFIHAMNFINPLLVGSLRKYRSIKATTVAQAMINQTFKNLDGIHTYPSNIIQELA
ncbi:NAD-dependent epimerase/dehydratase family protein [Paradesertivirga mongoliensis]|uniref:NAD-dependent epimerase/dehydratase family protein n=1 Tax=Paradesertivirga mongoliensis TaxID=2100740 RepID=A0ABW4ZIZ4_9SPHI|nr:NAD-dependent epimerase/dehydratase family protein [Pedobacter mongoliensis]